MPYTPVARRDVYDRISSVFRNGGRDQTYSVVAQTELAEDRRRVVNHSWRNIKFCLGQGKSQPYHCSP